jgi:TP901 family phage tail tape measure protein
MSKNLRLEVLLKAVDQATRPFNSIRIASQSLSGDIRDTEQKLRDLNVQAAKITGFRTASAQLATTGRSLANAKHEAAELAVQFRNTVNPTRAQAQALEAAIHTSSRLKNQYNDLKISLQRQRTELAQTGINTRTLSSDERRLKNNISATTAQRNRQQESLQRVNAQQERLGRVKSRYQSGTQLAGKISAAGSAAAGVATAGVTAGAGLLKPGYQLSTKSAELQAVLGLQKQSPELAALKSQAKSLGANTTVSPADAAAAQLVVANSGADANGILAQTPAILNMSLANKKTLEESAALIIGTKSAFALTDDKASHIADVISMTMEKTQATFEGISDSLALVAPAAQKAGVSLEEAAAMVGVLHDKNITGSAAGAGSNAVLQHLQTPTGKASDALNSLGVNTTDSQGNSRSAVSILKDIQASFVRNKLSAGQQDQYTKAIFGAEGSPAAGVLMDAAASGKLESLTHQNKTSDGKTAGKISVLQDNLGGDLAKLQSAYQSIGTDVFDQQEGSLRKLTQTATQYVLKLDGWINNNKGLAQTIGVIAGGAMMLIGIIGNIALAAGPILMGINAITLGANMLGIVFSTVGGAIATVLGAMTWPIVAVGVAIVAGALLIRKYWEPISAFFSGVIEGISAAFAPIATLFEPLLPVFDWLGEKLSGVWDWFTKLIEPVKSTQETLDSCKNAGVMFGQALASALTAPLDAFNKLRSGVSWLLEKIGVINKESNDLDKKTENARAQQQDNADSQPSFANNGNQNYQPVKTSVANSYSDQSHHTYNVTIQAGNTPSLELARIVSDELDKRQQESRARRNSQFALNG